MVLLVLFSLLPGSLLVNFREFGSLALLDRKLGAQILIRLVEVTHQLRHPVLVHSIRPQYSRAAPQHIRQLRARMGLQHARVGTSVCAFVRVLHHVLEVHPQNNCLSLLPRNLLKKQYPARSRPNLITGQLEVPHHVVVLAPACSARRPIIRSLEFTRLTQVGCQLVQQLEVIDVVVQLDR